MLLQAASAARLGYLLYGNPFIVVALYIESSGRVTRYFLFQRDGVRSKVRMFGSKHSWAFSLVLLGFLRLGRPRLDATAHVVYCYIRNLQPRVDDKK
jgi:hypothetical protein